MAKTTELPRGYVGTPKLSEKRNLRIFLKYPLGLLLPYSHPESTKLAIKYLSELGLNRVILVGDRVSYNFINEGFSPNIIIIDEREKRNNVDSRWVYNWANTIKNIKNPPGTISREALTVIKECINEDKCAIIVDGEEDLLVLPAILYSKDNTVVFYGLPDVGLILVKSEKSKKMFIKKILERVSKNE
ncbi:MAG: GTP-dependent dephospho-CoA kinase family protein [Thermoprotei archaeon]